MRQRTWIDGGLGAAAVALAATAGILSAHSSPAYRDWLYGLCGGLALVAVIQTTRAIGTSVRHEREIARLRARQDYLMQPESYRQLAMLFDQQAAANAAEERFREHFDIDDSRQWAQPTVTCKACGWQTEQALFYALPAALEHLDVVHPTPPPRGRWRGAALRC